MRMRAWDLRWSRLGDTAIFIDPVSAPPTSLGPESKAAAASML
jgi:hypothetical protein